MKKVLVRIALTLVISEAAYLVLVNLALNLPLTQSLVNQHRPEKYAVRWANAWSWYPLRVYARGVSVNGQTSSQQWQADFLAASATVALGSLLRKTVRVHDVEVQDIAFRQRPRPTPEKDYAEIREFFPPIQDRDPDSGAAARQPESAGNSWKVLVDEIEAAGSHDIWVSQIRALLDGHLRGNFSFQTRGGPVSLSGGEADIHLKSLTINRDWEVSRDGKLAGNFELSPFVPAGNPGAKAFGFLTLEADLDATVNSLQFLDFYLREFNGMRVDGKGRLRGHLKYQLGNLKSGTDLHVEANELALRAQPYEVRGDGGIDIGVAAEEPDTLMLGILFGALKAKHQDDRSPLFTGTGLAVRAQGGSRILLDEERESGRGELSVTIPSVRVPDLRLYQRFIPAKWDLDIKGGQGALRGEAALSASQMNAELYLASGDAELRVKSFRFQTNLDLGLLVRGGAAEAASVDVSGTYLRLDGARLASTEKGTTEPWQASFAIAEGTLGIPVPEGRGRETGFRQLSGAFQDSGFKELLASADGQLNADLAVSDLGWVNLLFRNPFDLAVSGSGTIATDLRIQNGWIANGTSMRVAPEGLKVEVLDYVAEGEGEVSLEVEEGGETPDIRLDAKLGGANLKRRGEDQAVVQDVTLEVSALAAGVALDGGGKVAAIDLRIPEARVRDMSVYNQFLPKRAPVKLLGGEAALTADVRLEPKSAGGFVKLQTSGLRSRLDGQEVAGELTLDIKLKDGVPKDMRFDISGSTLKLDRIKVTGRTKSFDRSDWNARFDLGKADVVWKKPMRLNVEAEIRMKDSRPIVAIFANQRGKDKWVDKILTVKDVRGKAELKVAAERVLVPYALVGSDKIDVGAKGLVDGAGREGIFYARFRKLQGILKIRGGERNFDIFRARETFDGYVPGETTLKLTGASPGQAEDSVPDAEQGTSKSRGGPRFWNWGRDEHPGKTSYERFMSQ